MRLLPLMVAGPAVLKVFAERYLLEPPSDSWELTPRPSGRRRSVARQVLGDANARAATSGCWLSQPTLPATQVREPSCVRTIGSTGGDGGSAAVASLPDGRRIEGRWTIPGAAGGGYD